MWSTEKRRPRGPVLAVVGPLGGPSVGGGAGGLVDQGVEHQGGLPVADDVADPKGRKDRYPGRSQGMTALSLRAFWQSCWSALTVGL